MNSSGPIGTLERDHALSRKTKIVATLGPASLPKLEEMIKAGVNVFRINFSHISDPYEQEPVVRKIRAASAALNVPVGILGDLCGPKIRTSPFEGSGSIDVTAGQRIKLVYDPKGIGTSEKIVTSIEPVCRQLQVGHRILFDDGNLLARVVEKVSDTEIVIEMANAWKLKSKKGINCPDVKLDVPAVTEKDAKDLKFIWQQRIDYAAMSFVQRKADVEDLRGYMEKYRAEELAALGGKPAHAPDDVRIEVSDGKLRVNPETWRPLIISKIETPGAIDDIDNILEASDGIMVARGDLGVELSLESVPIAQKNLIDKANRAGKPVITATQMLESMISAPVPTRAEVSDVANAVYDGTDAVMLSGEAAVGQYPVETVKMMATVCQASEQAHSYARTIPKVNPIVTSGWTHTAEPTVPEDFRHAIADGAIAIGTQARADAVMTLTTTGDLAALISKRRPTVPIIAATGSPAALFRMTLLYGVVPIYCRTLARVHDTSPEERSATLDRTQSASAVSGLAPTQIDPHHSLRTLLPSTDTVLAEVEKEARGMLKDKAIVVTASGYVHGLPGLSEICKLSRFGDATRALRARSHWRDAYSTVIQRRATPDPITGRYTPDLFRRGSPSQDQLVGGAIPVTDPAHLPPIHAATGP